ncbi:MAG: hypothetical protein IJW46_01915 [Clostridia bacterium]|nr:hypothetical protein [Clostridia bacterium]
MTDIEKIRYTKTFVDKLARGINPLDDSVIREDDVVNQVRISRCLYYVSELLDRLIMQNELPKENKTPKEKKKLLFITEEEKRELHPFPTAKHQTDLKDYFNSMIDPSSAKMKSGTITAWLVQNGFLIKEISAVGKTVMRVTKEGINIGLYNETCTGQSGLEYTMLLFSPIAQQFIFDHIDQIIAYQNQNQKQNHLKNENTPWQAQEDIALREMYRNEKTLRQIARALKRNVPETLARMKEIGILK